ncbi:MAG: hypothetical protein MUC36_12055 [Planctomycetes bacterium]|jgi:hypothetical protein|nr:hypothetical protein [Planctomycetota bacterium]
MAKPRLRPVFDRPLRCDPRVFFAELARRLSAPGSGCRGQIFAQGAILRVVGSERRLWSPALTIDVEPVADGGHRLHARFSPSSPVWTAFVAIYLALACLGIGAACYGGAQLIMKVTPWAFVGVPIALALAAFTYGAAFIGQGLGGEDMYTLRSFVEGTADGADAARA